MSEPTTQSILEQVKAEVEKEITEPAVQSMVDRAMDAAFGRYLEQVEAAEKKLNDARAAFAQDMHQYRTDALNATAGFITREEAQQQAKQYVSDFLNPLRDEWRSQYTEQQTDFNRESARRNEMLDQYMAEVKALAVAAQNQAIENEKQILALKETHGQSIKKLEDDVREIKRDIENNVKKVTQNSNSMHRLVGEFITTSRARDLKNDELIKELKAAHEQTVSKVQSLESKVQGAVDLSEDVDSRVGKHISALSTAILGNKDLKIKGLVDQLEALSQQNQAQFETLRAEQKALEVRQEATEKEVAQHGALYRAFQWFTEKHPRVGGALLGTFFFSQLAALYMLARIAGVF